MPYTCRWLAMCIYLCSSYKFYVIIKKYVTITVINNIFIVIVKICNIVIGFNCAEIAILINHKNAVFSREVCYQSWCINKSYSIAITIAYSIPTFINHMLKYPLIMHSSGRHLGQQIKIEASCT